MRRSGIKSGGVTLAGGPTGQGGPQSAAQNSIPHPSDRRYSGRHSRTDVRIGRMCGISRLLPRPGSGRVQYREVLHAR